MYQTTKIFMDEVNNGKSKVEAFKIALDWANEVYNGCYAYNLHVTELENYAEMNRSDLVNN